ncbi:ribosome small subunit-dependent GTPase A [Achromobacter aloeverae]|uniref:Small ribosomal subunit biogenesis GTPase RsgA n=1 Tax=Achromobacter aloeverae TaxID=1750518 RepID=A0A4Q1HER1_9BURK|nr:ribosome small subunit-dependent GTPase A [Achromobacter aloeverae]RXN83813.1 ribosome small subunit-dependent GTPase A [Achromobacter aloeverae]
MRGRQQGSPVPANRPQQLQGRIIGAHGRHFLVEFEDGTQRLCFPRGKKAGAAVGDRVTVSPEGRDEGAIDAILPRKNLLYRSDEMRSKQFAANVDRLFIVVAVQPTFSDDLAGRALTGACSAGIEPYLVLNKVDLEAGLAEARARLAPLARLGVPVLEVSAQDPNHARAVLAPHMTGHANLLLGQSGMGKSTLLNALVPGADAPTREHSTALDMGKHTTTSTRLYHLPSGGDLIDSPGFQAFGLGHLSGEDIVRGFPEFAPFVAHCRFYNCTHLHEPGCGVLAALREGMIEPARHALYQRIVEENAAQARY